MKMKTKILWLFLLFFVFMGISIFIGRIDQGGKATVSDLSDRSDKSDRSDLSHMSDLSFIKTLTALTFVLGLIFLAAYLYKKFAGIKTPGLHTRRVPIQMVGYLPLGEKRFLSVVEILGKHYFLGISQDSINMLSELHPDFSRESSSEKEEQNFETIFDKARQLLKNPSRPMRMKQ